MAEDLDVARRKMLRYVLRVFRRRVMQNLDEVLEAWPDYMQRAARTIEKGDLTFGLQSWCVQARVRKWTFAGELARRADSRWSQRVLDWYPDGLRNIRRPFTRWSDDIVAYAGLNWQELAIDEERWKLHCSGFLSYVSF